jgi:hypothetical protein
MNGKLVPASFCKGAIEEQMINSLFLIGSAKNAKRVGLDIEVPSSQHVLGV